MTKRRVERLNSLLKEVISEVIHRDIHHLKGVTEHVVITRVDITADLQHAKVFVSVLGKDRDKKEAVFALQEKAGMIAYRASKKMVLRYFPELTFMIDEGLEAEMHMDELLSKISAERASRKPSNDA
jgi:ribosome-binding factor A